MINTKTKGELGIRIEYDVEHDLFHPQNIYSDEYITPTFVEYVQKIEKENAELKEKYAKNITDCDICDTYCNSQLTKAKEIIREFVEWANWQGNSKCPSFKSIQNKAEQFLNSEVEKCGQ